ALGARGAAGVPRARLVATDVALREARRALAVDGLREDRPRRGDGRWGRVRRRTSAPSAAASPAASAATRDGWGQSGERVLADPAHHPLAGRAVVVGDEVRVARLADLRHARPLRERRDGRSVRRRLADDAVLEERRGDVLQLLLVRVAR